MDIRPRRQGSHAKARTRADKLVVLILLFTGWMGWQMVYRDHVGISEEPDPQGHVAPHHGAHHMGS